MATTDARNRVAMENDGSRVDARAKVTGAAKYTYDINLPGMVYAAHVRAPFAQARLTGANLTAARKIAGVLEVVLYSEDRMSDAPTEDAASARLGLYGGEAVGHVCAESTQLIGDAIAALQMEWEHGTPVTDFHAGAGPIPDLSADDDAKLNAILAGAAKVVEATYETQVQHHVSLESHGAVVHLKDGKAKVYGTTQGTAGFRDGLEKDLGIDKKDIEVDCNYVGGGFGSKFGPGIEGKLAARMAKKFDRPCKVMNSRKDESRDTGMRPGSIQYFKLGVGADGKIIGGRNLAWSSVGVKRGGGGINYADYNLGQILGAKSPKKFDVKVEEVGMSSCQPRPQRAPGWPQGAFALESMLDELAAAAGLDPIAFRKINDKRPPRHRMLDTAAKEIGWERRKPDGKWPGVRKRGFGCGVTQWHNEGAFPANAEARIYPDGKVEIRSGTQDIGTGNRTMLVDLLAHSMGLDRKFITGLNGSTEYPAGPASGGSYVGRSLAPAVLGAGELAAGEILVLAAKHLGVAPADLKIKGDAIVDASGAKKMAWPEACRLITTDFLSVTSKGDAKFRGEGESDGCCVAEVEVDTETGIVRVIKVVAVQQCGFAVNRKIVESQIVGGVIQGISYTLFEDRILNDVNGAPVNPNMEWYKIAGPVDIPEIIPIIDVPEGTTGVRALGEPPIIGPPGAIANAVANAIGARVRSMPITPARVLAALKEKGGVA